MMLECQREIANSAVINLPVPADESVDLDDLKNVNVVPVVSNLDLTMFLKI